MKAIKDNDEIKIGKVEKNKDEGIIERWNKGIKWVRLRKELGKGI